METVWYVALLLLATLFAFYVGARYGVNTLIETLAKRAERRMTAEEYKEFKGLIISLLIKEEGD